MARVEKLLSRGQQEGVFRTDLPTGWLIAVFCNLMHAAVAELDAGRLSPAEASHAAVTTVLAAWSRQAPTGKGETPT